eukprot:g59324.t1
MLGLILALQVEYNMPEAGCSAASDKVFCERLVKMCDKDSLSTDGYDALAGSMGTHLRPRSKSLATV